jgi:hypothetical protein
MTELRVSPNGVSHSAEKRFENTGSSRSSNTDLEGESEGGREVEGESEGGSEVEGVRQREGIREGD